MNTKQLNHIKCMLEDSESDILGTKGNEYVVSNDDRLKFFKDYAPANAERLTYRA